MSDVVRVGLRRGAPTTPTDLVTAYPDLRRAREQELRQAGCCGRAAILQKYEALARAKAAKG